MCAKRIANIYGPVGYVEADDDGNVRIVLDVQGELLSGTGGDIETVDLVNRTLQEYDGVPELTGTLVPVRVKGCIIGFQALQRLLLHMTRGRLKMFKTANL